MHISDQDRVGPCQNFRLRLKRDVRYVAGISEVGTLRSELYDKTGHKFLAFIVHGCRISEYQALPDRDVGANARCHPDDQASV